MVLFHLTSPSESKTIPLNKPSIVADSAGGLHVFWSVVVPVDSSAIYYTVWDGARWSAPVDILVGPNLAKTNNNAAVALDGKGFFHLTWQNDGLFYSRAHVSQAGSAHGWTPAIELAPSVSGSSTFVDTRDTVHVVYADLYDSGDLFYRQSTALGADWSRPTNISRLPAATETSGSPDLLVSEDGTIHVAWGQYQLPDGWPPTGVYYAKSRDSGRSWSEPFQLGDRSHGVPSLASLSDLEIHAVWLTTGTLGRFFSRSLDGGESWDPPRQFAADIQMLILGAPQLERDSAGQIHLVMSGFQDENYIFSSRWDGWGWELPERITDAEGRGENAPGTAMSLGNQLHVVWLDIYSNDVSYTWRTVDAPSIPPGVVPASTLAPTSTTEPSPTPTPTPTAAPATIPLLPTEQQVAPPLEQRIASIPGLWLLPVLFLVGGVVVAVQAMRRFR